MLTMNIYDNISPFVVCVNLRQLPVKAWLLTGQVCNLWWYFFTTDLLCPLYNSKFASK